MRMFSCTFNVSYPSVSVGKTQLNNLPMCAFSAYVVISNTIKKEISHLHCS